MMTTLELDPYLTGDVRDRATPKQKERELLRAEANVTSALRRAGYALPLAAPGEDVKGALADLVRYRLSVELGILPEPAHQSALYLSYKMAQEWLEQVAAGTVEIDLESSDSAVDEDLSGSAGLDGSGPVVVSRPPRGW